MQCLTADTVLRFSVRHYAKFHADQSNCCGDATIFRLFKMADIRGHLEFVIRVLRVFIYIFSCRQRYNKQHIEQ